MNDLERKLAVFAALLEQQQRNRFAVEFPGPMLAERMQHACAVSVKLGSKWARVDVGTSGKYMVNLATNEIVGIKAYGVPHPGHKFGTLDTVQDWDWSGYRAHPAAKAQPEACIN